MRNKNSYIISFVILLASTSQYGQVNGDIIGVTRTDTIQLGNEISPEGKIKYEANDFFGHDGTTWKSLTQASGGGASNALEDDDGDTKIELINGVGTDDDTLRISIDGVTTAEYVRNSFGDYRMNIKDTLLNGNLFIGNNAGSQNGTNPSNIYESKNNTAIGHFALDKNDRGYNNTAVGQGALNNNTDGFNNTAVGQGVLGANTTGDNNSAFGYNALNSNSVGNNNTAFGFSAMLSNTSGTGNTAYGTETLKEVTTGNNNSAFGDNALKISRGGFNTAIGAAALSSDTTGTHNTAIGNNAMANANGKWNTAIGSEVLKKNEASFNTAVGYYALHSNTTGNNNTAMGIQALENNGGSHNVAIGSQSMLGISSTTSTGNYNIGIGFESLKSYTTASENVSIGRESNELNTTGSGNVAVGFKSMQDNQTGVGNVALGRSSLKKVSSAWWNVAIGESAMSSGVPGWGNVAIGAFALDKLGSGSNNVMLGGNSGSNLTKGNVNVILGYQAGMDAGMISGADMEIDSSVFIGHQAGKNETESQRLYIANDADDKTEALIYGEFDNEFLQVNDSLEVTGNITEEGFGLSRFRGIGTAAPENTIVPNPEDGDIYLTINNCNGIHEHFLYMYADTTWYRIGSEGGCSTIQSGDEPVDARTTNGNNNAQANVSLTQSHNSNIENEEKSSKTTNHSNITQVMSLKEQAQAPDAPKLGDIYLHDNGKGASPQYEMRIYSGNTWEIIKAF